jgi:hypothetical protein
MGPAWSVEGGSTARPLRNTNHASREARSRDNRLQEAIEQLLMREIEIDYEPYAWETDDGPCTAGAGAAAWP